MDLGPHAVFIWSAYGITAAVVAALVYRAISQERKQKRVLIRLDEQGIRRRSDSQRRDGGDL
jgi:heme exporter protein CcmD